MKDVENKTSIFLRIKLPLWTYQEAQSAQTANLQLGGHNPVEGLQPIHGQLQVELAMSYTGCFQTLADGP